MFLKVFSSEICEHFLKNTYFEEHLRTATSALSVSVTFLKIHKTRKCSLALSFFFINYIWDINKQKLPLEIKLRRIFVTWKFWQENNVYNNDPLYSNWWWWKSKTFWLSRIFRRISVLVFINALLWFTLRG